MGDEPLLTGGERLQRADQRQINHLRGGPARSVQNDGEFNASDKNFGKTKRLVITSNVRSGAEHGTHASRH
jgi:hypothetical protein